MPACAISPADRRRQVRLVGNDLLKNNGRKPFYTEQAVKNANRRQGINYDVACWSHATFNSHAAFDAHHTSIGETCDYVSMKGEMLASVSDATDTSWFDIELSWLEFPDIDFSFFDFFNL